MGHRNRPIARPPQASHEGHCHALVKKTAEEMAGVWYDETAFHDNAFYAQWKSGDEFIRHHWGMFVKPARETLAKMLAGNYPEAMKNEIYEALQLDGLLH
jgi:hypothetical protein